MRFCGRCGAGDGSEGVGSCDRAPTWEVFLGTVGVVSAKTGPPSKKGHQQVNGQNASLTQIRMQSVLLPAPVTFHVVPR
jgi:hypothetical protein